MARLWFATVAVLYLCSLSVRANDESTVRDLLSRAIAKNTKTLKHSIQGFHYESTQEGAYIPRTSSEVVDHISRQAIRFFDPPTETINGDVAGPGFYLALDPKSTRGFGSKNWTLYTVGLRPGTRFYVSKPDTVSTEEFSALVNLGCVVEKKYIEKFDFILGLTQSKPAICRQMLIDTFRNKNVEAIVYMYMSLTSSQCNTLPGYAINVIKPNPIDATETHVFNFTQKADQIPRSEFRLANYIAYLYKDTEDQQNLPLFENLNPSQPPAGYKEWISSKILGCGQYGEEIPSRSLDVDLLQKKSLLALQYNRPVSTPDPTAPLLPGATPVPQPDYSKLSKLRGLAPLPNVYLGLMSEGEAKEYSRLEDDFRISKWIAINASSPFGSSQTDEEKEKSFKQLSDYVQELFHTTVSVDILKNAADQIQILAKGLDVSTFSFDLIFSWKNSIEKIFLDLRVDKNVARFLAYRFTLLSDSLGTPILNSSEDLSKLTPQEYRNGLIRSIELVQKCLPIYLKSTPEELKNSPCGIVGE